LAKESGLNHLVDGAIGGFVAGIFLQPLQVIKTAMQVPPIESSMQTAQLARNLNFAQASQMILKREGFFWIL